MSALRKAWSNGWVLLFLFSVAVGILLLGISAQDWFSLMSGERQAASFCSLNAYWDCDRASLSRFGSFFSFPVGVFGVLWFLGLSASVFVGRGCRKTFFVLSAVGIGAIFFLIWALATVVHAGCIICVSSYILMGLAIFSGHKVLRQEGEFFSPKRGLLLFVALVLLFGAWAVYQQNRAFRGISEAEFKAWWGSLPEAAAVPMVSPMVSSEIATPITVVEFSDFGCPFCARASEVMLPYLKMQKDVRIAFFPYPLDSACNPQVKRSVHPGGCEWTKIVFCSHEQSKGWEVHDLVFRWASAAGELPSPSERIADLPVDQATLATCLQSGRPDSQIQKVLDVARTLGINSTPTFYMNGKQLRGFIPMPLLRRVLEELRK